MAMPARIGGPREDKKPSVSLTVISAGKPKMPGRIGGPPSEDEEGDEDMGGEPIGSEQALDDATDELISALTSMKPDRRRVKEALRAAITACMDEGSD